MSTPPSAFDALMSKARAAAKKKPQSQSSTPKKRKTQTQTPTTAIAPVAECAESQTPEAKVEHLDVFLAKKPKTIDIEECIRQLRKKAADFDPKAAAYWEDKRVPFLFLARAFDMISKETGRLVITDIVCNMLRTVMHATPDDLLAVVYLSANKIAPAHEGLELGIGEASIIKALAEACGRRENQIKVENQVTTMTFCLPLFSSFFHFICEIYSSFRFC